MKKSIGEEAGTWSAETASNGVRMLRKTFPAGAEALCAGEVALLGRLQHPAMPRVLDSGAGFYLIPDYGPTLDACTFRWFGRRSRARIAARLAEGLFHLWRNGIVHGHLTARRVVVARDGQPVILDVGAGPAGGARDPAAMPFWQNPDLVGPEQEGVSAFWDQAGTASIRSVLGLGSEGAVGAVRRAVVRDLARSSGFHWAGNKGAIYGSIDLPGFRVTGRRNTPHRFERFGIGSLAGKRVLDVGCNSGSVSFECVKRDAARVIGLEYVGARVEAANAILAFTGHAREGRFEACDVDTLTEADAVRLAGDVTFCLALDHQIKFPEKLYAFLGRVTGETLYFESSRKPAFKTWCADQLKAAGFREVAFVGTSLSDDGKGRERMNFVARK